MKKSYSQVSIEKTFGNEIQDQGMKRFKFFSIDSHDVIVKSRNFFIFLNR